MIQTPTRDAHVARLPRIAISEPQLGRDVEELVLRVLRSGHLAQGPMVQRFEGLCADMAGTPALATVAARHTVAIVEDAAQAHGARIGPRRAGSFGLGCFSFYATKNVTSGEGGCVTTDDDRQAVLMRELRNQGMRSRYEY